MARRKKSKLRIFKKNKYNIFILILAIIIAFIAISFIRKAVENRGMSKYNDTILIIKSDDTEIASYSIKELRSIDSQKVNITLNNQDEKTVIEGVPFEKIISKLNIDPSSKTTMVAVDPYGNKKNVSMDQVLEPGRVYLTYKINSKPLIEYNEKYGELAIIDSQSRDIGTWILNVKTLNFK